MLQKDETAMVHKKIHALIQNLIHLRDTTGEYLLTLADGTQVDQISFETWEWTSGIGLYGMMKYYLLFRDQEVLSLVTGWFDRHLGKNEADKNINTMVQMLTLAMLYEKTGNVRYRNCTQEWAEWLYHDLPRTERGGFEHMTFGPRRYEQMWDDTLMMSVLTLAKIGVLLKKDEYVQEAKYQFLMHIQFLQDRASGLWYHGWTFEQRNNFGKVLWGRGNSWITMAIPEFLSLLQLPPDDALHRFLCMNLQYQMDALQKLQNENGMWHTVLDDKTSYLESSCTAGFSYGILKAVLDGLVSDDYLPMALRGVKAVLRNIDDTGALTQTSIGTAISNSVEDYKNVPRSAVPFGQSMAILCLCEYLRYKTEKEEKTEI